MSPRKLSQSEERLWHKISRTVTPRRTGSAKALARKTSRPGQDEFAAMLRVPPVQTAPIRHMAVPLDISRCKNVRRGRVTIEAQIDLHDKTQTQARGALIAAIIRASNRNMKCLLVITGKGPRLDGVIRRNFPDWINAAEIRPLIATYAPAHIRHGGSGAWYVFLKTM